MLQVRSNRTLGARRTASAEEQISKDEADALRDADAGAKEAREAERASGGDERADVGDEAVSSGERDEETEFSGHDHLLGPNGLAVVTTFPAKYERAKERDTRRTILIC